MLRGCVFLILQLSLALAEPSLGSMRSTLLKPQSPPVLTPWEELAAESFSRSLKIALVTNTFGPIDSGHGMGYIYHSLATLLHRRGHQVHVLLVGHRLAEYEQFSFPFAVSWVPFQDHLQGGAQFTASASIYEYLKTADHFDVVAFPDFNSPGFVSMQAKRAGLHFQDTTFVLGIHGGHQWTNRDTPAKSYEALVVEFMERRSALLADVIWSQSSTVTSFLSNKGWKWPTNPIFKLELPAGPEVVEAWQPKDLNPWNLEEIVYFGSMHHQKGIDLFVDAVAQGRLSVRKITFLGAAGNDTVISSIRLRLAPTNDLQFLVNKDRESALKYLMHPNRVAVIPSLYDNAPNTVYECLYLGVPMIVSSTSGVSASLLDESQLFEPNPVALASKLRELQKNQFPPRNSAVLSVEKVNQEWLSFFETPHQTANQGVSSPELPLVSVVITSYNRAQMLKEAVKSIEQQTYENIELVVVDDGSTDVDVLDVLADIEERHTVVRQSNQYLGAARNVGASKGKGEYILFLDDDNLAHPHMVSTQIAAIQRASAEIAVNGHEIWDSSKPKSETSLWLPIGPAPLAGLFENPFGNANFLISRERFIQLGKFTTDRAGWEDYEFHARAVLAGARYVVIPESLMLYRIHDHNLQMAFVSDSKRGFERVLRAYTPALKTAGIAPDTMVDLRFSTDLEARQTDPCQGITVRQLVCGSSVTFEVSATVASARRRRVRQLGYTFAPTPAPTTRTPLVVITPPGGGGPGTPPAIANFQSFQNSDGSTSFSFDVQSTEGDLPEGDLDFSFQFPCEGAGCVPTTCTAVVPYTPRRCCCYNTRVPGSTCIPNYDGAECESGIGICDRGDINADGFVDIIDLAENLVRWNTCDCAVPYCQFDYDYNADVDIADLANTLNRWGRNRYRPFLCCCVLDPITMDCYNVPSLLCELESNNARKRRTFFGCRSDLPLV